MSEDTEIHETHALTRIPAPAAGPGWALARLSDSEFTQVMEMARVGRERLLQVMRHMMRRGVHFDRLPGTDRDVLLKPGAEVIAHMFGLRCEPQVDISYGDGAVKPHISVVTKVQVYGRDGEVVATGCGSANSWEKKWRYRKSERVCPKCGKAAIIKGKAQYGGGWVCLVKHEKGGCGAKWPDGAEEIEGQITGQVENPDPYDQENTILKIATKRAKVDAIINATNSSDLFTQDLEEGGTTPRSTGEEWHPTPTTPPSPPPSPTPGEAEPKVDAENVSGPLRRKFMAKLRQLVNAQADGYPKVLLDDNPAGHEARTQLLSGILKMDVTGAGTLTPGEWGFAIQYLENNLKLELEPGPEAA